MIGRTMQWINLIILHYFLTILLPKTWQFIKHRKSCINRIKPQPSALSIHRALTMDVSWYCKLSRSQLAIIFLEKKRYSKKQYHARTELKVKDFGGIFWLKLAYNEKTCSTVIKIAQLWTFIVLRLDIIFSTHFTTCYRPIKERLS